MSDKMGGLEHSLTGLLKEAEKMQESMKKAQQELTDLEVVGRAGGGMVVVTMNGRHEILTIVISQVLMEEEKSMVEDLVKAAVNDAVQKVEKISKDKISQLTAGLNIPKDFLKEEEER